MTSETGTILDRIARRTASDLKDRQEAIPLSVLETRFASLGEPTPFESALRKGPRIGIVSEFKRASPSKGEILPGADPAEIAEDYIAAGTSAISVLTDEPYFRGSLTDLDRVSEVAQPSGVPVLRKDFVIDEYQIAEARAYGADAVLLIVALLKGATLRRMLQAVHAYGLEALVEVHEKDELADALDAGARMIGINNRDLRTFDVDLATFEGLAPQIPFDKTIIAESGIFTRDDVIRLEQAGAHAVLVGESLMCAHDRRKLLQELVG